MFLAGSKILLQASLRRISALFALASSYRFYRKNIKLSIFFTCKSKNFLNVLSESFCT